MGNAGTAARFLTALVCLGRGSYRLAGVPRMHERPQAALFEALRALGYAIDAPSGRLPARGARAGTAAGPDPGQRGRELAVRLGPVAGGAGGRLAGRHRGGERRRAPLRGDDRRPGAGLSPGGGAFVIEPDASSGSYFQAAGFLLADNPATRGSRVVVQGLAHLGLADRRRVSPLPAAAAGAVARPAPGRQHHDRHRAGPLRRPAHPVQRPGPVACAGVRAGGSLAYRADQVRSYRQRERRHPAGAARFASRRRDRDLRRSPHGHVFRHAGAAWCRASSSATRPVCARRSRTSSPSWRARHRPGSASRFSHAATRDLLVD